MATFARTATIAAVIMSLSTILLFTTPAQAGDTDLATADQTSSNQLRHWSVGIGLSYNGAGVKYHHALESAELEFGLGSGLSLGVSNPASPGSAHYWGASVGVNAVATHGMLLGTYRYEPSGRHTPGLLIGAEVGVMRMRDCWVFCGLFSDDGQIETRGIGFLTLGYRF